jgi:hypothetical protein
VFSDYCRPAMKLKQKTHRRLAVGLINFVNESKPDCRAVQQRVPKEQAQIQIIIHQSKLTHPASRVKS